MKRNLLSLLLTLIGTMSLYAQVPQAFEYSSIIRNNSGELLNSQPIGCRISIHDSTVNGTILYQETFVDTTNNFGLINLQIGNGLTTIGSFAEISWGINSKFMEIEIDPSGGTSYISMGTTQLLSVPYALFAENGGNWIKNGNNIHTTNLGSVSIGATTPEPSAKLSIKATNAGFLPPQVEDTNAVSTPAEGLIIYDLSSHCIRYFNGSMWSDCIGSFKFTIPWSCGDILFDRRDSKKYSTVQIGSQCWMAENINIGVMISGSIDQTDNGVIEKYCYNDSISYCDIYGGLYQWDEIMKYTTGLGAQGICPAGWHIPTNDEYTTLKDFLGSNNGGKMKEAGTSHWYPPNTGATNSSGFTGLPGGQRNQDSLFYSIGQRVKFYVSDTYSSYSSAMYWHLSYNNVYFNSSSSLKINGFSIRCLKN